MKSFANFVNIRKLLLEFPAAGLTPGFAFVLGELFLLLFWKYNSLLYSTFNWLEVILDRNVF